MTALANRRIALWVEARNGVAAVNPTMQLLLRELERSGATTSVFVPECCRIDPLDFLSIRCPDLILLKTATTFGLSIATVVETSGIPFLNAARATVRAHDKAGAIGALAAAGVPVPHTYLVSDRGVLDSDNRPDGQWVVKPVRGVHGVGVHVLDGFDAVLLPPEEESSMVLDDGSRLVQQHVGGTMPDVKVYVAGTHIFAAVKPFSAVSYLSDPGSEIELDRTCAAIVRAAGQALGLSCFGVDLRCEEGRPIAVDVNPFPGFRGFPAAVPALLGLIKAELGVRS